MAARGKQAPEGALGRVLLRLLAPRRHRGERSPVTARRARAEREPRLRAGLGAWACGVLSRGALSRRAKSGARAAAARRLPSPAAGGRLRPGAPDRCSLLSVRP